MVEVRVLEELDADICGFCMASEFSIRHSLDEVDFVFQTKFLMVIDKVQTFLAVADHDESCTLDVPEGIEEFEQSPALLHAALVEDNLLRIRDVEFVPHRKGFHLIYVIVLRIVVYGCRASFVQPSVVVGPCIVLDDDVVDEFEEELL